MVDPAQRAGPEVMDQGFGEYCSDAEGDPRGDSEQGTSGRPSNPPSAHHTDTDPGHSSRSGDAPATGCSDVVAAGREYLVQEGGETQGQHNGGEPVARSHR